MLLASTAHPTIELPSAAKAPEAVVLPDAQACRTRILTAIGQARSDEERAAGQIIAERFEQLVVNLPPGEAFARAKQIYVDAIVAELGAERATGEQKAGEVAALRTICYIFQRLHESGVWPPQALIVAQGERLVGIVSKLSELKSLLSADDEKLASAVTKIEDRIFQALLKPGAKTKVLASVESQLARFEEKNQLELGSRWLEREITSRYPHDHSNYILCAQWFFRTALLQGADPSSALQKAVSAKVIREMLRIKELNAAEGDIFVKNFTELVMRGVDPADALALTAAELREGDGTFEYRRVSTADLVARAPAAKKSRAVKDGEVLG